MFVGVGVAEQRGMKQWWVTVVKMKEERTTYIGRRIQHRTQFWDCYEYSIQTTSFCLPIDRFYYPVLSLCSFCPRPVRIITLTLCDKEFQWTQGNSLPLICTLIMEKRNFNDLPLFENGRQSSTCTPDPSQPSRSNENYEPVQSDANREYSFRNST